MKTVRVQSFGCRASQADGATLEAALEEAGLRPAAPGTEADLIVLNTCTVTHSADVDTLRIVRGLKRTQPNSRILVTGCYAQRAPAELTEAGADWVVGNSHKHAIPDLFEEGREPYHGRVFVGDIAKQTVFAGPLNGHLREDRTRPTIKVQDGCSNKCSFCVIPSVRGRSRSAPLEAVVDEVRQLAQRHGEIVLSGINLGRWGRDLTPSLRFHDLLRALLEQTDVRRLRISSVEPMDWSEELFDLIASTDRIAQHVHMPLQSGSDSVLKRMRRKYRIRHYASRLELAAGGLRDAAIGADVMTGFPGETDDEFQQTLGFIEQHPFTYLHVFTYSERPGTEAAQAGGSVPVDVRRQRTKVLRELSDRKNLEFRRKLVGKTIPAITLEQRGFALTTNFVRVEMQAPQWSNQLVDLKIGDVTASGLREQNAFRVLR